MERNSGVLLGTPYGLKNYYDRLNTDQNDSVVYGQRRVSSRVSNCHAKMAGMVKGGKKTNSQAKFNSHDPEYWIQKDICTLLDDRGGHLTPGFFSHSPALNKENTLRNRGNNYVTSMAGLSPSTSIEPCLLDQQRENLSSVFPETTCIRPQNFEKPYFQPVTNNFTHLWNQRQVSNARPEAVFGYLSKPTKLSGDNVESVPVHLTKNLSVGEQSGPGSFQNFWPPEAEAFSDSVQSQGFAPPNPLALDVSESVSSTSHDEEGHTSAHWESTWADVYCDQQLSAFSRKKILIDHWKLLEEHAKSLKEGSSEWTTAWQNALNFAWQCSETDYHFNLNVAKALTRLKDIDQAKMILLDQLTKCNDQRYLSGVNKQLGFLFFKKRSYVDAVKHYMRGFASMLDVPNETYSFILSSMKHTISVCKDQKFVTNAICWFNYLKPKSLENKVELSNSMLPFFYAPTSFSEISEPAINNLESDQVEWTITRWKELEALAASLTPEDPHWYQAWTCAMVFALECAKVDYHFNLNVAIALTRLNQLDQAIDTLFQQLRAAEYANDQPYLTAVNKQLGFIYFRKGEYLDSIHYYMRCFDGSKAIADKPYGYITTAMSAFEDGVNTEFRRSALDWYRQLYSKSMENKWLFWNKQPFMTAAPFLPLDSASMPSRGGGKFI
ncbi:hypothetical protein [Endozoicomonas sp. YOMI1]|uniref:hypothetical protein n=1 Tax=Endozoicomonas sp. YOMI1 TaxID=2828739 RepID=UPI0021492FAD|nr:hypothetical protein [Endozoicomonas sp. YOMI1]